MSSRSISIISFLMLNLMASGQVLTVGSAEYDLRRNMTGDSLLVYLKISEIMNDQGPVDFFDGLVSEIKFSIRWPEDSPATIGGRDQFCPGAYNISMYQNTVVPAGNGFNYITFHAFGLDWISNACPAEAWYADEWKLLLKIGVSDASCEFPFQIVNDTWTMMNGRETYLDLNGQEVPHTVDIIPAVLGEGDCGYITGHVFADLNSNCIFDGDDLPIPDRMVMAGDNVYSYTNSSGQYYLSVPFGDHTVQQVVPASETAVCPVDAIFDITVDGGGDIIHFFNGPNSILDLQVTGSVSFARPGFPVGVWMTVKNISYYPSGPIQLDLSFDPLLTGPSEPDGVWEIPALPALQDTLIHFHGTLPPEPALDGYDLQFTITVSNTEPEETLANNAYPLTRTVTNSYDPNDKNGISNYTMSGTQFDPLLDEWIDYSIRFQNTGSDTAFNIVIKDTVSMLLDLTSVEFLGSSHDPAITFEPGRTMVFTFTDILLPDSTTDLMGSQGHVSYRIRPINNIPIGSNITNTAGIHFDFNPPILTNMTSHLVEVSTMIAEHSSPALHVFPNPATDRLTIIDPSNRQSPALNVRAVDGRSLHLPIQKISDRWMMDVSSLPAGIYAISVMDGGSVRFIKH